MDAVAAHVHLLFYVSIVASFILKDNIEKNKEYFIGGHVIKYHINNLHNDLLEKNLIKIIKPYSVVEIDFVAKAIGLFYQEVLN